MSEESGRAALLFSQSVCAMLRGFGMISENLQRVHRGESIAYTDQMFEEVMNEFSIGWNSAVMLLRE
jgi:hypothetical protein